MADEITGPRKTWLWAGALLVLSGVLPLTGSYDVFGPRLWVGPASVGLFAVATMLVAIGPARVTGRLVWGTVALWVLGGWKAATLLVTPFARWSVAPAPWQVAYGYADLVVPLLAGIVAVTAVWRAGVVPRGWRAAPAIALGVAAVPPIAFRAVAAVPVDPSVVQETLLVLNGFMVLGFALAPLGLGIVALILGARSGRPASVHVYPPA